MNKIVLICFAVLTMLLFNTCVMHANESAKQTQADISDNTSDNLTSYLKHSSTKEIAPDERGFICRWFLLEPIRQPQLRSNQQLKDGFVQAAVKNEYFPNQFSVVPKDGDKVNVSGEELTWYAIDTTVYDVNLFSFAYALEKPTYNILFWAVTTIYCPQEMKNVRLSVGSNAASVWWVNDKEVIGIYGDRHMIIDDGVSKRLTLKKGINVIRGAVINAPGVSAFCARLLDSEGKPILEGYTVRLNGINN